jgi:esterase/lipase/1-acyl-sn-glycerol-3-phosphate acyltransferase
MNPFAYRTTALAIKAISNLSKARIQLHNENRLPGGSIIFVINHFTRLETMLMPYIINRLTHVPVWSLADYELFRGAFGTFLDKVGAVSTHNPDRDRLIVKTLLTGEAHWIIFPEGRMVKNMKIVDKGRFMVSWAGGKHPPHTGAATLAMRTEFYRQRLRALAEANPEEAERVKTLFKIDSLEGLQERTTYILPVNITYYPVRAKENILTDIARRLMADLPGRVLDELMTEGSMLLTGVDIDIRFGKPISVLESLKNPAIERDIRAVAKIGFDDPIASRRLMRRKALAVMERYMAAIYSMTTLNHDHLFASMLRTMPFMRVDVQDLCRRVFLAAVELQKDRTLHLHRSLSADQSHLLTDDRFGKVSDFISIALEKGNLLREGEGFRKDRKKFTSPYDFHRARIDNPIDVMANAVEPLKKFQGRMRRIAWLPAFWVRRRVAGHLMGAAVAEFTADYQAFHLAGESKPMDVGMPYLIPGRSKELGVVLTHGYMAAPMEVRGLAEFLGRQGFYVYAPRLKGHGTSPEDLAGRSYQDWIRSIDLGYAVISSICRHVVAGGFSTGAGLALHLAARVKSVCGVFAVSTPLRLRDFGARFAPAVDMWNRLAGLAHHAVPKMEYVENHPENPHINYLRNPVAGVREIERLMDDLEPRLSGIGMPALVVHSTDDPVVDPKGSARIFDLLGAEDKQYVLFSMKRHGILLGAGSERVYRTIGSFLETCRKRLRSAA